MYIWPDWEMPDDEQHTQHPERQCKVATHCTMTERCGVHRIVTSPSLPPSLSLSLATLPFLSSLPSSNQFM